MNMTRRKRWFQPARGAQAPSSPHNLGDHPAWAGGCGVASPNRLAPTPTFRLSTRRGAQLTGGES